MAEVAAELLEEDPDPATNEQAKAVREVERVIHSIAEFKHRMASEGISEIELLRLESKQERMDAVGSDLAKAHSLWQETTDLLMRTNLHERARAEELFHLRSLVTRFTKAALDRAVARAALQSLDARLRMLMPLEWFQDREIRLAVHDEICRANVEVAAVMESDASKPKQDTEGPVNSSSGAANPSADDTSEGLPHRPNGRQAAGAIGVRPGTLSGWHGKTPAWVDGELLFQHLIERPDGSYFRDRVLRLARWFRAAQGQGGQTPTPCPD